jgi:mRNA interferase RelE/StbE
MNPWSVVLTTEAQADILRLAPVVQARMLNRLQWIGDNASLINHQPMRGEWHGCYRYRVGDYRIIYQVDRSAQQVTVLKVGHRRDVYR